MPQSEEKKRDVHIGVMVTPAIGEKLDAAKSRRRGMSASKSSVVNDILEYFFAQGDTIVTQVIEHRINRDF